MNSKLPMVRCMADAEFLVEAASIIVQAPVCSQCNDCFVDYNMRIPFVALIATCAYRPATTLLNRFLSLFPPHSTEFNKLLKVLGQPPLPRDLPAGLNMPILKDYVEKVPLKFLLAVALHWPATVLGIAELEGMSRMEVDGHEAPVQRQDVKTGRKKGKARSGKGVEEEEEWEVWEEVRTWCFAAIMAWPSSLRATGTRSSSDDLLPGLAVCCRGKKKAGKRTDVQTGLRDVWKRSEEMRFRGELHDQGRHGQSSSSSRSTSSQTGTGNSSGSSGSSGKEEVPAYLKPWPGGVNLVACLREMLLGQPCFCPPSPAASSVPAAESTLVASNSVNVPSGAPVAAVANTKPSARCNGRVCNFSGCERAEGGDVKLRSCGGCGKVAYCSRECQKAHWSSHKLACPGRSSSGSRVGGLGNSEPKDNGGDGGTVARVGKS